TAAQRAASDALRTSVQDTLNLSQATLQHTGSAQKAAGVVEREIGVLERLGAKGGVAAELLRELRQAEDALHSKSITISVLQRGGIGGSVASGGGGGMLRAGPGYASGTPGAARGWAWVGEQGPGCWCPATRPGPAKRRSLTNPRSHPAWRLTRTWPHSAARDPCSGRT